MAYQLTPEEIRRVEQQVDKAIRDELWKAHWIVQRFNNPRQLVYSDKLFFELYFPRVQAANGQEELARDLYREAIEKSPAAARALRGTTFTPIRGLILRDVRGYVDEKRTCTQVGRDVCVEYCEACRMTLALGHGNPQGPPTDEERELLRRAVRFQPTTRPATHLDVTFRLGAAESLGTLKEPAACEALLSVLLRSQENEQVREGCREVLLRGFPEELIAPYRWALTTPERDALKRLAWEEVGWLRYWRTKLDQFAPVREDLLLLLEQFAASPTEESGESSDSSPLLPTEAVVQADSQAASPVLHTGAVSLEEDGELPHESESQQSAAYEQAESQPRRDVTRSLPTSPTKATPVAPAPPASGRQAGGERPLAGSDEGDTPPSPQSVTQPAPQPRRGYCQACLQYLNEEGLLTPPEREEYQPVPAADCVLCHIRQG